MTKEREGFHNMFVQIPAAIWQALLDESERREESATRTLTRILATHYRIPANKLPKPKRAGRPPKQA